MSRKWIECLSRNAYYNFDIYCIITDGLQCLVEKLESILTGLMASMSRQERVTRFASNRLTVDPF